MYLEHGSLGTNVMVLNLLGGQTILSKSLEIIKNVKLPVFPTFLIFLFSQFTWEYNSASADFKSAIHGYT